MEKPKSRRYGKRFSSPYPKWKCGHRHNPGTRKKQKRNPTINVQK